MLKFWKRGFWVKVSKNKNIEVEILYQKEWDWFVFSFEITRKCDHAGVSFELEIIGISFQISFYDSRHWNYDKNTWC